jgi:hypothetical protein
MTRLLRTVEDGLRLTFQNTVVDVSLILKYCRDLFVTVEAVSAIACAVGSKIAQAALG